MVMAVLCYLFHKRRQLEEQLKQKLLFFDASHNHIINVMQLSGKRLPTV